MAAPAWSPHPVARPPPGAMRVEVSQNCVTAQEASPPVTLAPLCSPHPLRRQSKMPCRPPRASSIPPPSPGPRPNSLSCPLGGKVSLPGWEGQARGGCNSTLGRCSAATLEMRQRWKPDPLSPQSAQAPCDKGRVQRLRGCQPAGPPSLHHTPGKVLPAWRSPPGQSGSRTVSRCPTQHSTLRPACPLWQRPGC